MAVKIVEGELPYTGGIAIEVTRQKVINLLLRAENNLLHVNDDNELYCDLQIANGIAPTDDFEVGVTTGIVNQVDGWPQSGLLLHYETPGGAYAQWLKGNDGKIYYDPGTGTFKLVYYAQDVDDLFTQLRSEISAVGYSGEYDDLLNRPGIVHISYSQEQSEWIIEGTMKDNCMCMITPYNGEVPATITVDGTAYTVLGNDGVTRKIYGNEPLVGIFQPDTENQVNYISTFLRKLDTALSDSSENAVQNKVVKAGLDLKANVADLATVATTGDYDDLINKPTIGDATLTIQQNSVIKGTFTANSTQNQIANIEVPTKISDLTDDSDFVNDYELASVAFTGDYANLINKPTIGDGAIIIQKNGTTVASTTANATTATTANIIVPEAVNNLTSSSTTDPLAANQGRILYEKVQNLEARGRFLSSWDCATGLPETNPEVSPYVYKAGDYYIIDNLAAAGGINYKPDGSSYTWDVASTTVDTNTELEEGDTYIFDGQHWLWQKNSLKAVSFPNIAGDAMDNTSLAGYFNNKQDTILAGYNITINADGRTINADIPSLNDASTVTKGIVKIASDTVQTEAAQTASSTQNRTYPVQNNTSGQLVVNVPWENTHQTLPTATSSTSGMLKLGSDTVQSTAAENVSSTANRSYALQVNSSGQGVVNVPWTDTTYTAGTNVTIDPNDNNKISVNIPAYSSATSSTAGVVKLGSDTVQTEGANTPSSTAGKTYAVQVNSNDQMVVNVPWTDTQPTSYSGGNGIDITNNTISVDVGDLDGNGLTTSSNQLAIDTSVVATQTDLGNKANKTDVNTKAFFLSALTGSANIQAAQDALDWYLAGNNPIIVYQDRVFDLEAYSSANGYLQFDWTSFSGTQLTEKNLKINFSGSTVSSITDTTDSCYPIQSSGATTYYLSIVSSLPANPDANTVYIVTS